MRIFATYSIKGGVGKTTSAVNLSYLSARDGARTLVWDLDPQAAATYTFRVRAKVRGGGRGLVRGKSLLDRAIRATDFEQLDLLPADFSYRHLDLALQETRRPARRLADLLSSLAEDYDRIFLDCPPSISLVSESVFRAADVLLVPSIPTTLSLRTLDQLISHLEGTERTELAVIAFLCMIDRRKSLHRKTCESARRDGRFLTAGIPYSSLVESMGYRRAPLPVFAPSSPAARAYEAVWSELGERPELAPES